MYYYIYTVVVYILAKQVHQGCRPATNIKKSALPPSCDPVYNSRGFFEPIMRSCKF